MATLSGPSPGLDKLKQRLKDSGQTLMSAASEALIAGADEIVRTAQFLAPRDSGKLKASIKRSGVTVTEKGNLKVEISAGDETTRVGPGNAFQLARIMEFGSKKMDPYPFMFPAYRLNKRQAKNMIRAAMRKAIRSIEVG